MSLIKLQGNASGTGALTIAAPNTNTDRTLTLPDTTGTIVMNEGSGIFKIDSSGSVGIGTATPAENLDIYATIPTIRLSDSDGSYSRIAHNLGVLFLQADYGAVGTGYMRFDVGSVERMRITPAGAVLMPDVYEDTVTGRDLFISSTGQLGYVSSTRASKINIQDLSDVSWLYSLNPVSFQYRVRNEDDTYSDEAQPQPEYGLIAEDVELVNPDLVFYDETENGRELRGIQYSRLIAPLLKAIQEQQSLITDLTARLTALEAN